jgi:CubicO group peptidase (beta-lactamase class C family)
MNTLFLGFFIVLLTSVSARSQQAPAYIVETVDALHELISKNDRGAISKFLTDYGDPSWVSGSENLIERLNQITTKLEAYPKEDRRVRPAPNGIVIYYPGTDAQPDMQLLVDFKREKVSDMKLQEAPESIVITADRLDQLVEYLNSHGMSGVLYVKQNGQELIKEGFGWANPELEIPNTTDKIFGIGSRPIDFTKAAIYLLEQQGKLQLSDPITKYFSGIPDNKQSIKLQHLMTGQSGLVNYIHNESDWNPDLAWVSRDEFLQRVFNSNLHFEPGIRRQHSHVAFGVLAAVVEVVSGQTYESFLDEHFFSPAQMNHTGNYGDRDSHQLTDFAVGAGPEHIGLPNIPPNWGPTSWLVKGSGGMYSSLGDLLNFYAYVKSDRLFTNQYQDKFSSTSVNLDGSVRGFELFSLTKPNGDAAYLLLNDKGQFGALNEVSMALEDFMIPQ